MGEGEAACGTCHGNPPLAPHPSNPACQTCHPDTVTALGGIDVAGGQHIDGELDLGPMGCTSCHGSAANAAPPVSTTGATATGAIAVGAHQAHLRTGAIRLALPCDTCHTVPTDDLHSDGTVDLSWSTLAGSVTWDRTAATCSTYCHGATLDAGGTNTLPVWTEVGTGQTACGTCHGNPPLAPHPSNPACASCHPDTVTAGGAIDVAGGQHIDGELDVGPLGCTSCHGSAANAAPPVATTGATGTDAIAVGAHQAHLRDGAIRTAVGCESCHALPTENLHANGTVDLSWSTLAGSVTWDRTAATCSTYCHGATLDADGTNTLPVWTEVGAGQTACGTCHGNPPLSPHPAVAACRICHPETVTASGAIDVAGGKHIDGGLQVSMDCALCHASLGGAHAVHAAFASPADSGYGDQRILEDFSPSGGPAYQFGCGNCHPLDPARHLSGGPVEVSLSPAAAGATGLRTLNRADAAYAGGKCSGVYCHSSGPGDADRSSRRRRGRRRPATLGCAGCHGNPPQYPSGGPGAPDANSHVNLADDWLRVRPLPRHARRRGTRRSTAATPRPPRATWPPITCQTCHFDTVDPANTAARRLLLPRPDGGYDLLPGGDRGAHRLRAGRAMLAARLPHRARGRPSAGPGRVLPLRHVNGRRDVVFDRRTRCPRLSHRAPGLATPTQSSVTTAARRHLAPRYATQLAGVPWPPDVHPAAAVADHRARLPLDTRRRVRPDTKTCSGVACHLERSRRVEAVRPTAGAGRRERNLLRPVRPRAAARDGRGAPSHRSRTARA